MTKNCNSATGRCPDYQENTFPNLCCEKDSFAAKRISSVADVTIGSRGCKHYLCDKVPLFSFISCNRREKYGLYKTWRTHNHMDIIWPHKQPSLQRISSWQLQPSSHMEPGRRHNWLLGGFTYQWENFKVVFLKSTMQFLVVFCFLKTNM